MNQLDLLIDKTFGAAIDKEENNKFAAFFEKQAQEHDGNKPQAIFKYMDDLDNKSSALLTHVSMLIAAMSLMMFIFKDNEAFRVFLLIELAIYVFVAAGLLRCVSIIHPGNIKNEKYQEGILDEVVSRFRVYRRARLLTIAATFALFFGVVIKVIIGD